MDTWKTIIKTAEKWYSILNFPDEYDSEFHEALKTVNPCIIYDIDSYTKANINDAKTNLIMCLYFCEALEKKYQQKNIPQNILHNTLSDIVLWTKLHYKNTGTFGLSETDWLYHHLSFGLFRIGRLQYRLGKCSRDIPEINVSKGDDILEIHIPSGSPLDFSKCTDSIKAAKKFYKNFFPEKHYKCMTCGSWLLGDTIKQFVKEDSNIIKFQSLFNITDRYESYSILHYTVSRFSSPENLHEFNPETKLGKMIKDYILNGGKCYSRFGYIEKN